MACLQCYNSAVGNVCPAASGICGRIVCRGILCSGCMQGIQCPHPFAMQRLAKNSGHHLGTVPLAGAQKSVNGSDPCHHRRSPVKLALAHMQAVQLQL